MAPRSTAAAVQINSIFLLSNTTRNKSANVSDPTSTLIGDRSGEVATLGLNCVGTGSPVILRNGLQGHREGSAGERVGIIAAMMPKVYIVILNWNNWRDTLECLESVYRLDYPA